MWIDISEEGDDHALVVDFTNDIVTINKWEGVGGWLVHTSKFVTFMMLKKVVVCIGSDGVEDIFRGGVLGRRWWANDVYVCTDGCVWADV